jgi:hypothetical protein
MTDRKGNRIEWWGEFHIAVKQAGRWKIGPMTLWIQREGREWVIAYRIQGDPLTDTLEVEVPSPAEPLMKEAILSRYSFRDSPGTLIIAPALADRPVITRPETPLYIPPGEEVIIFVSSPVWVQVSVDDPPVLLQDTPIYRPSDTWFGPSTLEGELCYASRTKGHLKIEDMIFRPHRAVTPILIRNMEEDTLFLERISLPVPLLSIYASVDGNLWTEPVTIKRAGQKDFASFEIKKAPPREAVRPKLISLPRRPSNQNILIRAFSAIFQ